MSEQADVNRSNRADYLYSIMDSLCLTFEQIGQGLGEDEDVEPVDGKRTKQLIDLPPELILSIANSLPPASTACLALCNHRFSRILGPSAWASLQLQHHGHHRISFLSLLEKDLPQYFACRRCKRLHKNSRVQWPMSGKKHQDLPCVGVFRLFGPPRTTMFRPSRTTMYFINYAHVQLAMKRHYYGVSHGLPIACFLHTELKEYEARGTVELFSVDARIVSNELLMRSQQWILVPQNRSGEFMTKSLLHSLCAHIRTGIWRDDKLLNIIRPRLQQLEARGICYTKTEQCQECHMDFVLDGLDFGDSGVALFVTRWVNLGAGRDMADPKWIHHHCHPKRGGVHTTHLLGSIRADFEGQGGNSVEEFTADNILKLFSRREQRLFTRGSDGIVWKLVEGRPRSRWHLVPPESAEEASGSKVSSRPC